MPARPVYGDDTLVNPYIANHQVVQHLGMENEPATPADIAAVVAAAQKRAERLLNLARLLDLFRAKYGGLACLAVTEAAYELRQLAGGATE